MACLACGSSSSKLSREHVFAAWLLDYLNARNISIGLFRRKGDGSTEIGRKEIALNSFTLKRICEPCNNGWMSRLEERAKPLVISLMTGKKKIDSLESQERELLARWAGKTAIIESHAIGAESPVDATLLQWMRTHEDDVPGRIAVVGCSSRHPTIGHMQVGVIRDLIGGEIIASNIVVLVLPNLILTCGFPIRELTHLSYDCRCDLSAYRPLWPGPASWTQMSKLPPFCESEDVFETVSMLAERIELFHPIR
jgi:hypothetical protein